MKDYKVVGKPHVRKDSWEKVTGAARYCADYSLPGQLYGAVYRAPVPHGIIKRIDISKAKSLPGVRAVVQGSDLPYTFGRLMRDQRFLAVDKVRFLGEPIVAVAADTLETANEAVNLIEVEIEELPAIDNVLEAVKPESPLVHESLGSYFYEKSIRPVDKTNIYDHFTLRKGDVEKGFAEADVIVENEYECAILHHAAIENHAAIAQVEPSGKVTVWATVQSPFYTRSEIARALSISENKVRIISPPIGGGFGG
nr:molybdopterin-dependent oxidoreductase [Spirochaetales bacterium]